MTASIRAYPSPSRGRAFVGLLFLVGGMAAGATVLWRVDGVPRVLAGLPDGDRIRSVLLASDLALADAITIAATVGWLVIAYLGIAVALRLLCLACYAATDGAAWTRAALSVSTVVTLPVVRRLVDGAVAGTLMVASLAPTVATAAAAPPLPVVAAVEPATPQQAPERDTAGETPMVRYYVQPGDTLAGIAEWFYGDGGQAAAIAAANEGSTGRGRVLAAGAALDLPLPADRVRVAPDGAVEVQVRRGDSLWRIATRLLGNGYRWQEIAGLNDGERMADGRRFSDPSLIYPGWWLHMPLTAAVPVAAPPTVEAERPVAAPDGGLADPSIPAGAGAATQDGGGFVVPLPEPRAIAITAAGFVVVAGAVVFVRRVRAYGLPPLPALPTLSALSAWRGRGAPAWGDAGRVSITVQSLAAALDALGLFTPRPLLAIEAARSLAVTLECDPGDADAIEAARSELGRRLGCVVSVADVSARRVQLRLTHARHLADGGEEPLAGHPLLVPVGAHTDGIVYLNLAAAGSVCVVGTPVERERLLDAWAETIATTCPPGAVAVRREAGHELVTDLGATIAERGGARLGAPAILGLCDFGAEAAPDAHALVGYGPPSGVYPVCAVDDADYADRHNFGATVAFGRPLAPDAYDDEGDTVPDGALHLTLAGGPVLRLEPIRVRVDDSPRWQPLPARSPIPPPPWDVDAEEDGGDDGPEWDGDPADDVPGWIPSVAEDEEAGAPDDDLWGAAMPAEETAPVVVGPEPVSLNELAAVEDAEADLGVEGLEEATATATPAPAGAGAAAVRQGPLFHDDLSAAPVTAAARAPVVQVRCLGPLEIECDGRIIEPPRLLKARELLAFLAVRGGGTTTRDVILSALWADIPVTEIGSQLHDATFRLRKALRDGSGDGRTQFLLLTGQYFRLEMSRIRVDLDPFEAGIRRAGNLEGEAALAEYERALDLYRGELLADDPYDWAEEMREEYRRRRQDAARAAGDLALSLGDAMRARRHYQSVIETDPIDELAVRGLMRVQAMLNDPIGARKVYLIFRAALRQALDLDDAEPTPETTELLHEISVSGGVSA